MAIKTLINYKNIRTPTVRIFPSCFAVGQLPDNRPPLEPQVSESPCQKRLKTLSTYFNAKSLDFSLLSRPTFNP